MKPSEFVRLPRLEQIRHLILGTDADGRTVFLPMGAANPVVRTAYLVPSEEVAGRLLARYSLWSRIVAVVAIVILAAPAVFLLKSPDFLFELARGKLWALCGTVLAVALSPTYLPGWITLVAVGPLARAGPRSYRDVLRHQERVQMSTRSLWLASAAGLAIVAAQAWFAIDMLRRGHTGAAVLFGVLALTLVPVIAMGPSLARIRRLRADNERLEAVVRERTAELEDLNRTLEARVTEQVRDIERLGQLRHFFAAPVAEMILGGKDGFDPARVHRRELSVISVDLRGFTAFSETAEPEEVIGVLRIYHAELGILVNRHQATLEHFAGDGAIIFLNDPVEAPDHPERAVRLAVELRAAMRPHLDEWRRLGFDLGLGTGVAVGYATIGAIGYEGRWEYAAIGSVCNLASRLCAHAKDGQVVTTHRVRARIDPQTPLVPLGELTLRGFAKPVAAFDVAPAGA